MGRDFFMTEKKILTFVISFVSFSSQCNLSGFHPFSGCYLHLFDILIMVFANVDAIMLILACYLYRLLFIFVSRNGTVPRISSVSLASSLSFPESEQVTILFRFSWSEVPNMSRALCHSMMKENEVEYREHPSLLTTPPLTS